MTHPFRTGCPARSRRLQPAETPQAEACGYSLGPAGTSYLDRLACGLLAAAALLLVGPRALARPEVPFDQDNQAFRFILWQEGLSALGGIEKLAGQDPARCVLVVFGNTRPLFELRRATGDGLRSFVEKGGAVLIATDRGLFGARGFRRGQGDEVRGFGPRLPPPGVPPDAPPDAPPPRPEWEEGRRFRRNPDRERPEWRSWDAELGVSVSGRPVKAQENSSRYRGSEDCPILRPLVSPLAANPWPLPPVSLPLATNRPSYLEFRDNTLTAFLGYPPDCHVPGWMEFLPAQGLFLPFGAGGTLGKGRVLVLADHSIFINGMMLQTDNGNFDFAYSCVHWLLKSEPRRDRAVFIDEGTAFDSFEVPLTLDPGIGPSPVDLANQFISQLEEENFFNRLILRHVTPAGILRVLALVGTLLLVAYGLYRLVRAGYHLETQVPLVSRRVEQLAAAPGVMDQRHRALLRQDNLWEAARDLARTCFAGLGLRPSPWPDRAAYPGGRPRLPRVRSSAGWWRRRSLREAVFRLWRLASNPRPRRVSRRRFGQLVNQVEAVKAAVRDGTLQITGPRESP